MEIRDIIVDTDIGDDIDDALAIALAVKSPEINLIGITTVFRNAKKRAQIAQAILKSLGVEDIPVYAGIDTPLVAPVLDRDNDKYDVDGYFTPCQYSDDFYKFGFNEQHAIDFIIEAVKNNPGHVTLVPIGPLTNIAIAIRKAPEITSMIKEIVMMGGVFTTDISEWNILCDPEAAKIVLSSGIPIKAVGLDVTMQCSLDNQLVAEFKDLSSNLNHLLAELLDKWFKNYGFEKPVLHDPLTIGTLINRNLVHFSREKVSIRLNKEEYGRTKIVESLNYNDGIYEIEIADEVDSASFLSLFKERIFHD